MNIFVGSSEFNYHKFSQEQTLNCLFGPLCQAIHLHHYLKKSETFSNLPSYSLYKTRPKLFLLPSPPICYYHDHEFGLNLKFIFFKASSVLWSHLFNNLVHEYLFDEWEASVHSSPGITILLDYRLPLLSKLVPFYWFRPANCTGSILFLGYLFKS